MAVARASLGQKIGPYLLERRLGSGGMAEVFLARRSDGSSAERVAIKRILPEHAGDDRLVGMFCDEARIAAYLEHRNIARLVDFGEQDGELFIAMEYVDGTTCSAILKQVSANNETVPTAAALFIAREVLEALSFAHAAADADGQPLGIVHRDVSPSNVLVSRSGDVKLIDFGIGRSRLNERPAVPGELRGKLRYLSPEQILSGQVDVRSDLYSLGVTLSEMLLGRALFKGRNDLDTITRICRGDSTELAAIDLPQPLTLLLARALAYRPEDRFACAADFRDQLCLVAAELGLELSDGAVAPWLHTLGLFPSASAARSRAISASRPISGTPTFEEPFSGLPVSRRASESRLAHAGHAPVRGPFPEVRTKLRSGERRRASLPTIPDVAQKPLARNSPSSVTPTAPTQPPSARGTWLPANVPDEVPRPSNVRFGRATYRLKATSGKTIGPVTREQLLELIATGKASGRTLVSLDGEHFMPAQAVPALAEMASRSVYDFGEAAEQAAEWSLPLTRATLPSVLFTVAIQRRSGLLVLRDAANQHRIYVENGDPAFVASSNPAGLLGRRLIASGLVAPKLVQLALLNQPPLRLGEALVTLGALTPAQLVRELSSQLEARLLEAGEYVRGTVSFISGRKSAEQYVRTTSPTLALISRLVRESYFPAEFASLLGPLANHPIGRGPRYRALSTLLGLPAPEYAAIERASGAPNMQALVGELAREGVAQMPETLRAVFIGLSAGVLRAEGFPHLCERGRAHTASVP